MALMAKFVERPRDQGVNHHIASIVANLNNVLNTKRDYGSPLRDYGVEDLSGHRTREAVAQAVIDQVRECIDRHEPRVRLEEIIYENDHNPLRLSFTIRCTIRETARALQMYFDTVFGKVNIGDPGTVR